MSDEIELKKVSQNDKNNEARLRRSNLESTKRLIAWIEAGYYAATKQHISNTDGVGPNVVIERIITE